MVLLDDLIGVIGMIIPIAIPLIVLLVRNNKKNKKPTQDEYYWEQHKVNSVIFFTLAGCGVLAFLFFTVVIRDSGEGIRNLRMLIGGLTILFLALGFLFLNKWKKGQNKE